MFEALLSLGQFIEQGDIRIHYAKRFAQVRRLFESTRRYSSAGNVTFELVFGNVQALAVEFLDKCSSTAKIGKVVSSLKPIV